MILFPVCVMGDDGRLGVGRGPWAGDELTYRGGGSLVRTIV